MSDPIEHLTCFCGDYCGKCPNYIIRCPGCLPDPTRECYFIDCCMKKNIAHCGLCDAFPCQQLRDFVPDDRPGCAKGYHIESLKRRAEIGDDKWLAEQKEIWDRAGLIKKIEEKIPEEITEQ